MLVTDFSDLNYWHLRLYANGKFCGLEQNKYVIPLEATRGWRKFHTEELHKLYASPNSSIRVIKSRMRWVGHVTRIRGMRNAHNILVGKLEGKVPLRRLRRIQKDKIRLDLRKIGYEDVDWIHLAKDWML
jgi:hypothetical protein